MAVNKLTSLDLNLLVALDALLAERNVTRAGKRVGMTQPAMSRALARLREVLDDPLLVRGAGGMVITPRGQRLITPVRRTLAYIESALLTDSEFDPQSASHSFTLHLTDYAALVVLPPLMRRLAQEAPNVDVRVSLLTSDPEKGLASGDFDLAVLPFVQERAGLFTQRVFEDLFVCVVRTDHPHIADQLTLDEYCQAKHILVTPRADGSGGLADKVLAGMKRSRKIVLQLPQFVIAPLVVARSDLILTIPRRVAESLAALKSLKLLSPPLELGSLVVSQVWHESQHHDPAHIWLRHMVVEAVKDHSS